MLGCGGLGISLWVMVLSLAAPTVSPRDHIDIALTVFPVVGYALGQRRWRQLRGTPGSDPMPAPSAVVPIVLGGDIARRDLDPTLRRTMLVWWALTWRGMATMLASMIIGGALGGLVGVMMLTLEISPESIGGIASTIGAGLGVAMSIIPVRLVLGKDFGEFRLVLLAPRARSVEPEPPSLPASTEWSADGQELQS